MNEMLLIGGILSRSEKSEILTYIHRVLDWLVSRLLGVCQEFSLEESSLDSSRQQIIERGEIDLQSCPSQYLLATLITFLEALADPIFNKDQFTKVVDGNTLQLAWDQISNEKKNLAERLLIFLRSLNQSESYVTLVHINSVFGKFFVESLGDESSELTVKFLLENVNSVLSFSNSRKSSRELPLEATTLVPTTPTTPRPPKIKQIIIQT